MNRPAAFAAVLGLTRAASNLGDHIVQDDFCACVKSATDDAPVRYAANPGDEPSVNGTAAGRRACAWHCFTYVTTQAAVVGLGTRVLGIRLHPGAAAAATVLSFASHYAVDRRVPGGLVETLAAKAGKKNFFRKADHGINGVYLMDRALHHGFETLAALIAITKATSR
ncbi:hypothetical protein [Streptomyces xiamenensis]|uniref:hypothetical protein n=1 Tax=Streptomyces xiamenensis TaxID=408015 RepID=UPI0035DBAD8C